MRYTELEINLVEVAVSYQFSCMVNVIKLREFPPFSLNIAPFHIGIWNLVDKAFIYN